MQELGPRLCRASPSRQDSLRGAGSPRRGAAQLCVRPAEAGARVGLAPAGSYTWGTPLQRAQPRSWPRHSSFLVLSVLLRLHRRSPRARPVPTQTLLQPPVPQRVPAAAGTGTGTGRGGTWGSSSSCRGALQDPCRGAGGGSILPLQINLSWVKSTSCQRAGWEARSRSVGMCLALGVCCGMAPPFLCSHVGWGERVFGKGVAAAPAGHDAPPHPALLWPSCSPLPTPPAGD